MVPCGSVTGRFHHVCNTTVGLIDELRPELPVEKFAVCDLARSYEYSTMVLTA